MAFDAGTIIAHMDLDLDAFNKKLKDAEDRADRATRKDYKIRISAVFDDADTAKARRAFANLDQLISRDAMSRLRSSPQGSILGSLNALFSPHQVAGGPTPQQAATQGMLGRTVKDITGGAAGGPVIKGTPTQQVSAGQSSGFWDRVVASALGAKAGGGGGGGGFGAALSKWLSSGGGGGGRGFAGGLAGGIGPGILGVGPKVASIIGGGGALLGALPGLIGGISPLLAAAPGLAGIGLLAKGVTSQVSPLLQAQQAAQQAAATATTPAAAKAAQQQLAGVQQAVGQLSPALQSVFKSINQIQTSWQKLTASFAPVMARALSSVASLFQQLLPDFRAFFSASAGLMGPLIAGLGDIAKSLLPLFTKAIKVATPEIRPLLDGLGSLVAGILPGLITLVKAASPAVTIFAKILGMLGRDLGSTLADFAPVAKAGAQIFQALMGVVGAILPLIGKLAQIFAAALAPAVVAISSVLKALLPVLIPIGNLIASLAAAVLGDLVSALTAAAQLLKDIAPSLGILFGALKNVFNVLENSGAFATFGDALEKIVPLLANFINQMVKALAPALPQLIQALAQLSNVMIQLLAAGLTTILVLVTPLVVGLLKLAVSIIGVLNATHLLIPVLAIALIAILAINAPVTAIIVLITALAGAITLLVTHWSTVWGVIKHVAADAWSFIYNGFGKFLLPLLGPAGLIALGVIELYQHWNSVWGSIKGVAMAVWQAIDQNVVQPMEHVFTVDLPGAFGTAARLIGTAWTAVQNAVKAPVKFVVDDVLDGLITVFDDITNALGLKKPIPVVHPFGLAGGGKITRGSGEVADDVLVRVSKNETVVSAAHSRALAPFFAALGVPGYARGGVPVSDPHGAPHTGSGSGLPNPLHGAVNLVKITAALATGNATALTNAISAAFGHGVGGAAGELGKILVAIPGKLTSDVVHWLLSHFAGGGAGGAIVKDALSWLHKIPYVWGGTSLTTGADCSGFTQAIYARHGITAPRSSEAQGAWIRKGPPVPGGLAFYHSPAGGPDPGHVAIVQNAMTAISQGGGMGPILMGLHAMPLLFTGSPPGGLAQGGPGPALLGGTVQTWIRAAMADTFAPASWLNPLSILVQKESGGNPGAIDPITVLGQHAEGLWQMLPSTFAQYATVAGGIFNPVSEGVAAIRYIMSRWGSPFNIPGLLSGTYKGYDTGGWLTGLGVNMTGRPEAVLTPTESQAYVAHAQALSGGSMEELIAVVQAMHEEMSGLLRWLPGATGGAVADTLNDAGGAAVRRAHYGAR